MTNSEPTKLLDDLQNLLQKQIDLARQGNVATVEQLSEQGGALVKKITALHLLEMPRFRRRRTGLEKLYRNLHLLITSGKDEISRQMKQIHKGKMTVKSYRENLNRTELRDAFGTRFGDDNIDRGTGLWDA